MDDDHPGLLVKDVPSNVGLHISKRRSAKNNYLHKLKGKIIAK